MAVRIHPRATVHPTVLLDCADLTIGPDVIIRAHAELYGRRIVIGRESFIDEYAVIGGGAAEAGEFVCGPWLQLGMFAQVNIARAVHLGEQVGVGIGSRIFTHGTQLSEYDGFPCAYAPVSIGSRVWLPNAIVTAGVTIGDNVVVVPGSVVNRDIPSGSFAGGSPSKVIKENAYPSVPENRAEILQRICDQAGVGAIADHYCIDVEGAIFNVDARTIVGTVTPRSELLKNHLRRHGIRFHCWAVGDQYVPWGDE